MKKSILLFVLSIICLTSFSQETGTFTDPRDGKVYKTVKIGNQWIMAENLAYKPDSGNYWAYSDDPGNVAKYGYLYDWETAKSVAPQGWHLPSNKDIETLFTNLGGLNDEQLFNALISGGSSGFNALFGGVRLKGVYKNDLVLDFWTSTISLTIGKQVFVSLFVLNTANKYAGFGNASDLNDGFSVRLFRD